MSESTSTSATSRRAAGNAGGVALRRVRAKLSAAISNGQWYEAHQLYRTLFFRLSGQRAYDQLEVLLFEGAIVLFDANESGSGVDLTKLYLDTLSASEAEATEEALVRVTNLFVRVPENSADKDGVLAAALRWSDAGDSSGRGHPRLHQLLAHNLWRAGRYAESRQHFLHSRDGRGCGSMLAEFHSKKGYPSEIDIFAAATVLQLACLGQHVMAALALQSYAKNHPAIRKGPPYGLPLLNFVWLLLLAIEQRKSLSTFTILVTRYQHAISRDPGLMESLDKIGQNYFGVPPPERPRGGLFGGLFDSFMTMLNDDDGEDQQDRQVRPRTAGRRPAEAALSQPEKQAKMEAEDLD